MQGRLQTGARQNINELRVPRVDTQRPGRVELVREALVRPPCDKKERGGALYFAQNASDSGRRGGARPPAALCAVGAIAGTDLRGGSRFAAGEAAQTGRVRVVRDGLQAVGAVYAARCTPSLPFCCCAAVADRLADSFSTSGATTTAASSSGGRERRPWWTHGDVCRRPRRPGGGGRRRPATAGLRQLVVPPRFKRVDQAPHGTAAPHLKRFAAEKRPFPARGDTQGAMTASIVLSRRCKMTVCND